MKNIECGKTKISGNIVMNLFKNFKINPMWLYGESTEQFLKSNIINTIPKAIILDKTDNENILMVNQKAAAGYPQNISNTNWYEALPNFGIPLPEYRNSTHRAFQVEGDSMLPKLKSGEWLICKALETFKEVKPNLLYVVILKDGVLVKKIQYKDENTITLVSINALYDPQDIENSDILEIWEVSSKLSLGLNSNISSQAEISDIYDTITDIRQELRGIKESINC